MQAYNKDAFLYQRKKKGTNIMQMLLDVFILDNSIVS